MLQLEGSTRKSNLALIQGRMESCWPNSNYFIGEPHQDEREGEEVSSTSDVRTEGEGSEVNHGSEDGQGQKLSEEIVDGQARKSLEEIVKGSKEVEPIPKKRPGRGRGRGRKKED